SLFLPVFPVPCSLFPVPCSLFPDHTSKFTESNRIPILLRIIAVAQESGLIYYVTIRTMGKNGRG
ncbi:MAG: hypothetical protein ACKPGB_09650, partial [Dolichospermum sp.]